MVKKKLKHYFLSVSISHKQPNKQQTTKQTTMMQQNKRVKMENPNALVDAPLRIAQILDFDLYHTAGETFQEKLNTLSECNCCDRHQHARPSVFAPWVDTAFSGTQDTPCQCKCRHLARIICRQC